MYYSFCSQLLNRSTSGLLTEELLQRLGIQKEGYPKAILEYAVTRFYCSVSDGDQLNVLFI